MSVNKVLMSCKLMPYYRLGVFLELSSRNKPYIFDFFGDTKAQGGIKQIPYSYADKNENKSINWVKTKNYFYKPERLLWQTEIVKQIFKSEYKVFVFEGAIAHYPIWLFAFLCKIRGKKVLYWTHGNRGLDKGIKKKLRKILFDYLGDGLLLYGNYQRNNMIGDGYDPEKLFVIYNALQPEIQFEVLESIDTTENYNSKKKIFNKPEYFTLIFIGRLVKHKGVGDILDVVDVMSNTNTPVNCIFIGEGEELQGLKSKTVEKDLSDKVHFAGALYNEKDIAYYFAMSDLLISPGNVGLNCIHALAYGVPVITHNNMTFQNPEVEAIIDNVTGVFFEHDNFDDLIVKLSRWIHSNNKQQNKIRCQKIIRDIYNPVNQTNIIISSINKILNAK